MKAGPFPSPLLCRTSRWQVAAWMSLFGGYLAACIAGVLLPLWLPSSVDPSEPGATLLIQFLSAGLAVPPLLVLARLRRRWSGPRVVLRLDERGLHDPQAALFVPWSAVRAVRWRSAVFVTRALLSVDAPERFVASESTASSPPAGWSGTKLGRSTVSVLFFALSPGAKSARTYMRETLRYAGHNAEAPAANRL